MAQPTPISQGVDLAGAALPQKLHLADATLFRWILPRASAETIQKLVATYSGTYEARNESTLPFRSSVGILSSQATKRIMSEWRNLMESPPPWTIAAPAGDDLGRWRGFILGPPHTPYSGGAFEIEVVFPPDYPIKPMSARFITRIFHPNVTEMGIVIIGPLTKEAWSPVQTISHILMHITSIMIEPVEPFDCEELSSERETLFVLDRRAFDEKAKDWTEKYAV